MFQDILFFVVALAIFGLILMALEGLVNFFVNQIFKKKPTNEARPRQPQYTEEEIKMAQYLEQKTQSDQRYYAFRQMMHEAARNHHDHR